MLWKIVKRILIFILILVLLIAAGIIGLIAWGNYKNAHYYELASPVGEIEKKYTGLGPCDVAYAEFDAGNETYGKYEVWYPAELEESQSTYPLVVMANGTGTPASKYKEVFRHLASWGFIVIGNEDENSRTGSSSEASLNFMLEANEDQESIFYGKVAIDRIGIAGHSQGGVGTLNAVTAQPGGDRYKAMFTASATSSYWGQEQIFGAEWSYDVSKVNIPYFMVAGTGLFDAGRTEDITPTEGQGICPLWSMQENYAAVCGAAAKVMARRVDADHSDMLRQADGYMTAWFMWLLQEDEYAAGAFTGSAPELLDNELWQDQQITIPDR